MLHREEFDDRCCCDVCGVKTSRFDFVGQGQDFRGWVRSPVFGGSSEVEAREVVLAGNSILEHDNGRDREGCKMISGFLGVLCIGICWHTWGFGVWYFSRLGLVYDDMIRSDWRLKIQRDRLVFGFWDDRRSEHGMEISCLGLYHLIYFCSFFTA